MRRLATGVVLLLAAGCFAAPRYASAPNAPRVHRGTFVSDMVLTGELEAATGAVISMPRLPQWQASIKWLATDGADVKEGDRVVELDNGPFTSTLDAKRQALVQARQELTQKEAEWSADLAQKQLDMEKKRADYEKTKIDADVPKEIVSGRDFEDRQIKYKRATVEFEKAAEVLRSARAGVASDRANLVIALQKAERELGEAENAIAALTLRAPRAGIVVVHDHPWEGRKMQEGDPVWVGFPIAMIPEVSSLQVGAALADVDDGRIAPGMPVTIVLDAYPSLRYPGHVTSLSAVAQESARASMRRAFKVTIALDRIDRTKMRPGLSVRAIVRCATKPNVLLVPRFALDFSKPAPRARVAGGRLADVTLGSCNAQECVVTGGLREGDLVSPEVRVE